MFTGTSIYMKSCICTLQLSSWKVPALQSLASMSSYGTLFCYFIGRMQPTISASSRETGRDISRSVNGISSCPIHFFIDTLIELFILV